MPVILYKQIFFSLIYPFSHGRLRVWADAHGCTPESWHFQLCWKQNHWNTSPHWQWSWRKIHWPKLCKGIWLHPWNSKRTPHSLKYGWNRKQTGKGYQIHNPQCNNSWKNEKYKTTDNRVRKVENHPGLPMARLWKPRYQLEDWGIQMATTTFKIERTTKIWPMDLAKTLAQWRGHHLHFGDRVAGRCSIQSSFQAWSECLSKG